MLARQESRHADEYRHCNPSSYGAAASYLTGRSRWHRGTRDARQGFKVERHVVRGVETLFGILFQAVTDDALQSRRHVKIGFGVTRGLADLCQLRQSEIEQLYPAIAGDEDVLRLQIAMHNAFVVRCGQATGSLEGVVNRFAERQGTRA